MAGALPRACRPGRGVKSPPTRSLLKPAATPGMLSELHPLTRRRLQVAFLDNDHKNFGAVAVRAVRAGARLPGIESSDALADEWFDFAQESLAQHFARVQGFVYLISGHAQAGLVKVGQTRKSPRERARTLYTAAVLLPLQVLDAWAVHDRHWVERETHRRLSRSGVPRAKEFFSADLSVLRSCICHVIDEDRQRFRAQGFDVDAGSRDTSI